MACDEEWRKIEGADDYIGSRHITDVLKGKRNHVKGWHFFYESEVIA